jgi:hypothetical protein
MENQQFVRIQYNHDNNLLKVNVKAERYRTTAEGERRRKFQTLYTYYNNFPDEKKVGSEGAFVPGTKSFSYPIAEGEKPETKEEMEYLCKKLLFTSVFEHTEKLI